MDEEELQKRFTDCVYFLASPLTCKKGIECEYRHSEIVRLNPRDCWFWLGGCCFNPDCAFRHPPIERLKEAYFEPSNPNHGHAFHVDKKVTPCYFFSKGLCNKADKCSFLHGLADNNNFSKPTSTLNNKVVCEKKLSLISNTESTPAENHSVQSEPAQMEHTQTVKKHTQVQSESEPAQMEHTQTVKKHTQVQSESLDMSEAEIEENVELVQSESDDVSNDQLSDQVADGYIEHERWLDSSLTYNVLVEGESERLRYEEEAYCFSVSNDEIQKLDPNEYHPAYPELGYPLREERYEVCDRLDNKQAREYSGKFSEQSRQSIFYRLSFQKRNLQTERLYNTRRVPDLREHLKKRRVADNSPRLVDYQVRRYPLRHGSHSEVDFDRRIWSKKPRFYISEARSRRMPKQYCERKFWKDSAIFTGPKTLDEIKEEKKRALKNRDLTGSCNEIESGGFQGPRPLSEILKNKRKFG